MKSQMVMLDTEEDGNLIMDLKSVTFAEFSGLGSLLMAQRLYRDNGRSLILAGVAERVRKLLEISQLSDVFVLLNNTDAALDHLREE